MRTSIDEVNRKFAEKIAAEAAQRAKATGDLDYEEGELPDDSDYPVEEFEGVYKKAAERHQWYRFPPPVHIPQYVDSMLSDHRKSKGKIIAWGWFQSVKAFIVKRERGVEYYENNKTLQTLRYYDWMAMARLKMLNPSKIHFANDFEKKLRWGFNVSWKREKLKPWHQDFVFRPQFASKFATYWNKGT